MQKPAFAGCNAVDLWKEYCWGIIPSNDDAAKIAEYSPIVEIGSGTGYWAYLISQAGAVVHAYDKFIPVAGENQYANRLWYDVKPGGPETVKNYGHGWTLLLIRPPSDENAPMAKKTLKNYGGDTFVYAGEVCGSNANKSFFDYLYTNFDEVYSRKLKSTGMHENFLMVFRRKPEPVEMERCSEHMVNTS